MIPKGGPGLGVPAPEAIRPHLVARLRPGWRFDEASERFLHDEREAVFEPSGLPEGSEIVHMVPDLQDTVLSQLSEDEAKLATYLHILLPSGCQAARIAPRVVEWPCLVDCRLPPEVSLPMDDAVPPSA